ncbi:MAG: hypothetical protein ABIJ08_03880, partial [Nanoarchaeota archaeon]
MRKIIILLVVISMFLVGCQQDSAGKAYDTDKTDYGSVGIELNPVNLPSSTTYAITWKTDIY